MTGRERRRSWPGVVVGLAGLTLLVYLVVPPDRARLDRVLVAAVALYVLWTARRRLPIEARPVPRWEPQKIYLGPPEPHRTRLARIEASLSYAGESQAKFDRTARPLLRRLVEDRLVLRHGVVLDADPTRARQLMGEQLWQMVSSHDDAAGPGRRPDELARLVALIERI